MLAPFLRLHGRHKMDGLGGPSVAEPRRTLYLRPDDRNRFVLLMTQEVQDLFDGVPGNALELVSFVIISNSLEIEPVTRVHRSSLTTLASTILSSWYIMSMSVTNSIVILVTVLDPIRRVKLWSSQALLG